MSAMTRNQAPVSDRIIPELCKWLGKDLRRILLEIINKCWGITDIPTHLLQAGIASLYSKGGTAKQATYRPISLFYGLFKILASLLRNRLSKTVDKHIMKTQYGFRKHKNTSQTIFLARRLLDLGEKTGKNIGMVLLDWEKAVDKVNQKRLIEALNRLIVRN